MKFTYKQCKNSITYEYELEIEIVSKTATNILNERLRAHRWKKKKIINKKIKKLFQYATNVGISTITTLKLCFDIELGFNSVSLSAGKMYVYKNLYMKHSLYMSDVLESRKFKSLPP